MIRRTAIVAASTAIALVSGAVIYKTVEHRQAQAQAIAWSDSIAQASPGDRPASSDRMRGLQDLNLSADQMTRIQQIRTRYREQLKGDRDALRQADQDLRSLMAGTASDDQIRAKQRQVRDLRIKLGDAQFNSMLEMRNVLTPEQRQKFAQRMEKRRSDDRPQRPSGMS